MRFKCIPLVLAVLVALIVVSPAFAGEKDKAPDKKPVNPFLAAAGEKARAETDEVVTLSNEDLGEAVADEVPPLPERPVDSEQKVKKGEDGKSLSFTNDDLTAMFGEAEELPATPDAAGDAPEGQDPLEWMEERKQAEADRKQSATDAEARVAAAERRIKDLESRLLATRNPLLTRRTGERGADPEASEEDKAAYDAAGARDRVATTEKQLEEARKELAEAKAALAESRGR